MLRGQKLWQPFGGLWQLEVFDGRGFGLAAADQVFVKRAESAETKLDGRAAHFVAAEVAQVTAKIITLQGFPFRGLLTLLLVPLQKLVQRVSIVSERVR